MYTTKLYHGDFHDLDVSADVLVTEPLFYRNGMTSKPMMFNPASVETYEEYIQDIIDTVKCPVMCFIQPDFRDIPSVFDGWVISKLHTGHITDYVVCNKGSEHVYYVPGGGRNPRQASTMMSIVKEISDEGQTIYDPFMGYGTTGLACQGRNFIGAEIEKRFFDIASEKILKARDN